MVSGYVNSLFYGHTPILLQTRAWSKRVQFWSDPQGKNND
jgi:hypothetical protein